MSVTQRTIDYCVNNKVVIKPTCKDQYEGLKKVFKEWNFEYANEYVPAETYNFSTHSMRGGPKISIKTVGHTREISYMQAGFRVITANQFFHNDINNNNNSLQNKKTMPTLSSVEKLKNLEDKILKKKPLRLNKFLRKNKGNTVEEFLIQFFTKLNNEYQTIYYEDRTLQTDVGKRRSLEDIFLITRYYFKTVTLKEVTTLLYSFFNNPKIPCFRSSICSIIKRRTFYVGKSNSELYQADNKDEFNLTVNEWKEIIK